MAHPSLKEIAYDRIRKRMLNHEFEPGGRIREDLLADELSMSRTPVREAINQFMAEGLIVNKPRKGLFFVELTSKEILDILRVRERLEALAIDECIEKIDPQGVAGLSAILDEFEQTCSEKDFQEHYRVDSRFHKAIAELSGNRKLIEFIYEIEDLMRIVRGLKTPDFSEAKREKAIDLHRRIVRCMENRDTSGAKAALTQIIQGTMQQL
jgi:DNA-binding GntR family transcriptional regulator